MSIPFVISLLGGLALAIAAVHAWRSMAHRRAGMTGGVALHAAILGVLANTIYVGWALADHGVVETFRQAQEATLVLASLIAIVGIGTYLSATLRGLDGLLFLMAALADFAGLGLASATPDMPSHHLWFITHGLSFAVSGACLMAAGIAGLTYLVVFHVLRRKRAFTLVGRVPSLEALDRFKRWMLAIGFPIFTYGILTGLCGVAHDKNIGRTTWFLDPTVVSCVLAWLVYAWLCGTLMFHSRIRGRTAAGLTTCGMALVVAAYFFMEFGSPIHR